MLTSLPSAIGHELRDLTQQVAIAVRSVYDCAGVSTRQHNEPVGNQDVWHLHVHVFPRHHGDALYQRDSEARWVSPQERAPDAEILAATMRAPRDFT